MRFKNGDRVIYAGSRFSLNSQLAGKEGIIFSIRKDPIYQRSSAEVQWNDGNMSTHYLFNLKHSHTDIETLVGRENFKILKELNNEV